MKNRAIRCTLVALLGLTPAVLLLWLGMTAPARADVNVYCVNATGTGCDAACGGGCYGSVQAAVDAAPPGGEVRIAEGTYTDPGGTVAAITKAMILRGGYDPACATFDPGLYRTVLDAQWGGSVISITNAGDVVLENLTLTHGDGSGNCGSGSYLYGCGGGIYADETNLHIGNCVITDNVANRSGNQQGEGGGIYAYADNHVVEIWESQIVSNAANTDPSAGYCSMGGGVYVLLGDVSLVNNQIQDNVGSSAGTGAYGGGLYLHSLAHATVLTNTIQGNKASNFHDTGDGGGLYIAHSSSATISGNRIEDNWTTPDLDGWGGGVCIIESDVHLTRNTIISNSTGVGWTGVGGGVYIGSSKPVTLSNNLIVDNDSGGGVAVSLYKSPASQAFLVNNTIADNGASGVVAGLYAVLTTTNNILAGHTTGLIVGSIFTGTVTADHNLFWNNDDPLTGTNAILQDPLLTSDYHLQSGSPAVDAGVTIPWLTTDLEGNARPQGGAYDLGAYEGVREKVFLPLVMRNP